MKKPIDAYEFKEKLKSTFAYDDDFTESIVIVTDSLIQEYGEAYEDMIKNAILSCKIEKSVGKKIEDYSKVNGTYESEPQIEMGSGGVYIKSVKRNITLPSNFDALNQNTYYSLVSNLNRLIRSYVNEYRLSGEHLEKRNGLMHTTYNIDTNNKLVSIQNVDKMGIGFEEGIIEYETFNIMRNDYDGVYEPRKGNDNERVVAGFLADSLGLRSMLMDASMTGNFSDLASLVKETINMDLKEFLSLLDKTHEIETTRIDNIVSGEKLAVLNEELDREFNTNIVPVMSALQTSMNLADKNDMKAPKIV